MVLTATYRWANSQGIHANAGSSPKGSVAGLGGGCYICKTRKTEETNEKGANYEIITLLGTRTS